MVHPLLSVAAAALWCVPSHRAKKRRMLDHLLAGTREVSSTLVWSHIQTALQRVDLTWRDEVLNACELEGIDHLHGALREGRGAILVFCHTGMWIALFPALGRAGLPVTAMPLAMRAYGREARGRMAIRAVRHREIIENAGTEAVPSEGSFRRLRDTIAGGGTVALAFDIPGSLRATFIHRERWFASGAIRLALESGAPILPISVRRHGIGRLIARLEKPVDPVHYVDRDRLGEALARRLEPHVLRNPAGQENPLIHLTTTPPG